MMRRPGMLAFRQPVLACLCGGMVDTADLKSAGCKAVPVRVRLEAPNQECGEWGRVQAALVNTGVFDDAMQVDAGECG